MLIQEMKCPGTAKSKEESKKEKSIQDRNSLGALKG